MAAVGCKEAVGKLQQVESTVLVKTIHNPHLVKCQMWLVEGRMERHYSD
jgi:hypothetical protein